MNINSKKSSLICSKIVKMMSLKEFIMEIKIQARDIKNIKLKKQTFGTFSTSS